MKTSHQFARELLALPDLPIFHYDPSMTVFCDEETDYALGEPKAAVEKLDEGEREEGMLSEFITIEGNQPTEMEEPRLTT